MRNLHTVNNFANVNQTRTNANKKSSTPKSPQMMTEVDHEGKMKKSPVKMR